MGTKDTAYTKAVRFFFFFLKKPPQNANCLKRTERHSVAQGWIVPETAERRGCRDQPERPCSVTLF